jgi:arsenate reductase (thioredoxin)
MKVHKVLFLCTGNSARSILAEAILNKDGAGRFYAYSAGSHPKAQVNPAAMKLLGELGYPLADLKPESWDDFAVPGAPQLDFVFTLCDDAAGEICPVWPGQPISAHWGIPDPAAVEGDGQTKAFWETYCVLKRWIDIFLNLPLESIDAMSLQTKLREIGRTSEQDVA